MLPMLKALFWRDALCWDSVNYIFLLVFLKFHNLKFVTEGNFADKWTEVKSHLI